MKMKLVSWGSSTEREMVEEELNKHLNSSRIVNMVQSSTGRFTFLSIWYEDNISTIETKPTTGQRRDALLANAFTQLPVSILGLSTRALNVLNNGNIATVGQLLNTTEEQLRRIRNCGTGSIENITAKLSQLGIAY